MQNRNILFLESQCKFLTQRSHPKGVISIWNSTTFKRIRTTKHNHNDMIVSMDKKRVAMVYGAKFYIWNIYNGEFELDFDILESPCNRINEMIYCYSAQILVISKRFEGYYSDLSQFLVCNPPKNITYPKLLETIVLEKFQITALAQVNDTQFACAFAGSICIYEILKVSNSDIVACKNKSPAPQVKVNRTQYIGHPIYFEITKLYFLRESEWFVVESTPNPCYGDGLQVKLCLWNNKTNEKVKLSEGPVLKLLQASKNTLAVFKHKGRVELWNISLREKYIEKVYKLRKGASVNKAGEGILMVYNNDKSQKGIRFLVEGNNPLSFSVYIGND